MSKIIHCTEIPEIVNSKQVIIDGRTNTTSSDFFRSIWEQLDISHSPYQNWNAYLDWMRDLSWLDAKVISIVIINFDLFLSLEPEKKKFFELDLQNTVFPFWENDAKNVFENPEELKEIFVYCIH